MIFLRPWFLLVFFIPFFVKEIQRLRQTETPWTKFIDKKLLPALLIKDHTKKFKKLWNWRIGLLWLLWTLALAGPAFYKLPTPAIESAPNTIVVFDLSMQAKELLQGQAKLYDLLFELRGERVGLVVFGEGQGYTAIPLTPDIGLIKEVIPTLSPSVLPVSANNPKAGFAYASKLLDNSGGKGRILYITDKSVDWSGKYPFGVLDLTKRSIDNSDILALLSQTKKSTATTGDSTFSSQADVWADLGGWLVLLTLPFFAFMFRKGILFLILFLIAFQADAGFFWRPDQQLYQTESKAIKAYQNRNYKVASKLFQDSGNLYNLGNALAFSGDIQGAINAYKQELDKNPNNKDAQFNKEYLEKQLPPPEEQQKQNKDGESQDNRNNSDENSEQNQQDNNKNEQKNQEDKEQNNTDSQQQEQSQEKSQAQNQPTQEETQKELEQALAEYKRDNPYNQEEQQIINRINHDPSRVLRYRLLLQHQKGKIK